MENRFKTIGVAGDISVSRNVMVSASVFDAFELDVIIRLLKNLREYLYSVPGIPTLNDVTLRFTEMSKRHGNRKELVERINQLRKKDIRYGFNTPGAPGMMITGLFTSVAVMAGGVLARVSREAIPWLLYIGSGVGYSQVEPEVFFGLRMLYHKRLYLFLLSKTYNQFASFRCSWDDLRTALEIPDAVSVVVFKKRYLRTLMPLLDKLGSKFVFSYHDEFQKGVIHAGRPSLFGFELHLEVKPEFVKKPGLLDEKRLCLNKLQLLYTELKQKNPKIMLLNEIFNRLEVQNACTTFIQAMDKYADKTPEHQANIMVKILHDRYGIDINSWDMKPTKK